MKVWPIKKKEIITCILFLVNVLLLFLILFYLALLPSHSVFVVYLILTTKQVRPSGSKLVNRYPVNFRTEGEFSVVSFELNAHWLGTHERFGGRGIASELNSP